MERFYYYLTGDERTGDLMTEVKDAEQKLYILDPMRLAQPREKYPCTAPARLRIGPDWLAYAGNWMTQWERTGDTRYRDMITAGMKTLPPCLTVSSRGPRHWASTRLPALSAMRAIPRCRTPITCSPLWVASRWSTS